MHYYLFFNHQNISYNTFKINDFLKAKLPKLEIDDEYDILAKIVKKYIIYRLYKTNNTNVPCITFLKDKNTKDPKIYSKSFPKEFQIEKTTNKNRYPLYKKMKSVS